MFHADRWVKAFTGTCREQSEESLACLKALTPAIKNAPGIMFGHSAAARLEQTLRDSIAVCGAQQDLSLTAPLAAPLEYAIRFIVLLVEKNGFKYIDLIQEKIGQWIDEQKGILNITAETAFPLESAQEEELKKRIMAETKTSGIRMKLTVVPELLGGYRLRMGGFCIDASLKGALENMTADLARGI